MPSSPRQFIDSSPCGILFETGTAQAAAQAKQNCLAYLHELGLAACASGVQDTATHRVQFQLNAAFMQRYAPQHDSTRLELALQQYPCPTADPLEREILLAMLLSPQAFVFPDVDELRSAVRVRQNIVQAARKTALAFNTEQAERPADYWTYDEARGFTVLPGKSLLTALQKATQPELSGKLYAFSCYRATEYVTLLGLAQELQSCNPALLQDLQRQWETRAVMSGRFHAAFLREYGSLQTPLPAKFYVPGDRLWFRNPDEYSSNIEGYEGSWVFYLGGGRFNNFWKRDQPYSFDGKCLEIYHWRHGARLNPQGKLYIDEDIVEARVAQTQRDPAELARVLALMQRCRDPQGVYADGGCIDATRECVRWLRPGHSDIVLPDMAAPPAPPQQPHVA